MLIPVTCSSYNGPYYYYYYYMPLQDPTSSSTQPLRPHQVRCLGKGDHNRSTTGEAPQAEQGASGKRFRRLDK